MKIGDLVRDIEDGEIGIIIGIFEAKCDIPLYTVMRPSGLNDAMWGDELEVINESR